MKTKANEGDQSDEKTPRHGSGEEVPDFVCLPHRPLLYLANQKASSNDRQTVKAGVKRVQFIFLIAPIRLPNTGSRESGEACLGNGLADCGERENELYYSLKDRARSEKMALRVGECVAQFPDLLFENYKALVFAAFDRSH